MLDSRRHAAGVRGRSAEGILRNAAQRHRRCTTSVAMAALVFALLPRSGIAGPIEPRSGYLDQTLARFNCTSLSDCANGAFPVTGVIVDRAGNLYGTAQFGQNANDPGLVFELTPPISLGGAWTYAALYDFCSQTNCTDGELPNGLIADSSGNLYGTGIKGGSSGDGVVFELTPPTPPGTTWTYTLLYSFCSKTSCADGANPWGKLTMDASGNLYGTTSSGGSHNQGAVFELTPNQSRTVWTENVLYNFCSQGGCVDGQKPLAGLLLDGAGNLYGTTVNGGGSGVGTVFELTPPTPPSTTWTQSVLYSFTPCRANPCLSNDSQYPETPVIMDAAGNLYGTTLNGGTGGYCTQSFGCGTVFEISPPTVPGSAWTESVIYSFCSQANCSDGLPYYSIGYNGPSGLNVDMSGGVRLECGGDVSPATGQSGCDRITLLGTTFGGGKPGCALGVGCGVAFALTPNLSQTIWTESVLYSFCSQIHCDDGYQPMGGLAADASGNLYGMTYLGGGTTAGRCGLGDQGCGVVFKLVPPGTLAGPRLPVSSPAPVARPPATPPLASQPVATAPQMPERRSLGQ